MKLEIEITEAEIKDAIERKIRQAIADRNNAWDSGEHIKGRIKEIWLESVDKIALELIGNSEVLHEMINKAVEAKVKARVTAALKAI